MKPSTACRTAIGDEARWIEKHDTDTDEIEATSLLGQPLQRPVFPDDVRERLAGQLAEAEAAYAAAPESADAILLLGQRTGAIGRLREAIAGLHRWHCPAPQGRAACIAIGAIG